MSSVNLHEAEESESSERLKERLQQVRLCQPRSWLL